MEQEPPSVGVEQRPPEREPERGRPRTGRSEMGRALRRGAARPGRLDQVAGQEGPDQGEAEDVPPMQVGPDREEGEKRPEASRDRPIEEVEQQDRGQQGEEVRPGDPVSRGEHGGGHARQVGQERVGPAAEHEPGEEGEGDGEQEPGEDGDPGEPGDPFHPGVGDLAQPLEREKRPPRGRVGPDVLPDQPASVQHERPQPEMPGRVAVAVEEPAGEAHGDDDGPDREHQLRQGRPGAVRARRPRGSGAGGRDLFGNPHGRSPLVTAGRQLLWDRRSDAGRSGIERRGAEPPRSPPLPAISSLRARAFPGAGGAGAQGMCLAPPRSVTLCSPFKFASSSPLAGSGDPA